MEECENTDESDHPASPDQGTKQQSEDENYCNPEPPAELQGQILNADNIGETVFSKHWLFTTLMKLIQVIDSHENNKEEKKSGSEEDVDIDSDLQDELCKLWDMSMNPEVVKFLEEFKAVDILTGVIAKSHAPRATEICVGILGNMACRDQVCLAMSQNQKLVELLLLQFETSDSPTLVELTRLLHVCVSCSLASSIWITAIKNDPTVFTHISFILQSSTNSELLKNVGELIDTILYIDDDICQLWSSSGLVLGVMEVLKQLGSQPGTQSLETFLHILQLISTCEPGVEALVSYGSELIDLTMKYLLSICEEDLVGIEGKENYIGSALSVLNILVGSWEDRAKFIQEDFQLMRCVLKILEELLPKYNKTTTEVVTTLRQRSKSSCSSSPPPFSAYVSTPKRTDNTTNLEGQTPTKIEASVKNSDSQGEAEHCSSNDKTPSSLHASTSEGTSANAGEASSSKADHENLLSAQTGSTRARSSPCVKTRGAAANGVSDESDRKDETDKRMIQMLYDVIQTCLVEISVVLKEICLPEGLLNNDNNETDSEGSKTPDSCVGIPETLDYLDDKCPSQRLRYMFHVLKQASASEGLDLLQIYYQTGKKLEAYRITRIIEEEFLKS